MIKSMTGFGRGEYSDGKRIVTVEIRTVNHRYSDVNVKMPKRYSFAEEALRGIVKANVKRGKADVSVVADSLTGDDITVELNMPVAKQYIDNLRELRDTYDVKGEITIETLALLPDVMKATPSTDDEDEVTASIEKATSNAVEDLDAMRAVEGEKLAADLKMRGKLVRDIVKKIETRAPFVATDYKARLEERIKELVEDISVIPEERILTEAAIFADKSNITEELVRLDSHMKQLANILESGDSPVGKKLDFLVQEMNRETNTIGSKANDLEITSLMLEAKSEIEKIREQVQNIE